MTRGWKRSFSAGLALLGLCASSAYSAPTPSSSATAAPATRAATSTAGSVAKASPPFARVYLATRGCMSCAHCRTSIRQMLGPQTKGAETLFGDDQIEVAYPTPREIPLRDVIHSLAENRLHDLTLVDVLFDAPGVVHTTSKGGLIFEVAETGQPFPLVLDPGATRPADGALIRLTAVVEGWRDKGPLSLHARDLRAKS